MKSKKESTVDKIINAQFARKDQIIDLRTFDHR